jgi:hypothetical protein
MNEKRHVLSRLDAVEQTGGYTSDFEIVEQRASPLTFWVPTRM